MTLPPSFAHLGRRLAALLLTLAILLPLPAAAATDTGRDALFAAAGEVRSQAAALDAEYLAPQSWQQGAQAWQRASDDFERGRDIERVRRDLEAARSHFATAASQAADARERLGAVLEARALAREAQAPQLYASLWEQAESQLRAAASNLERGRESQAETQAEQALERYRDLELTAIEGQILSRARAEVAEAQRQRVDRHAPRSLAQAQRLLAEAEQRLAEDRYSIQAPRRLAEAAANEARHARYLANRVQSATSRGGSVEDLVLDYLQPLLQLAEVAGIQTSLEGGPEPIAEALAAAMQRLQAREREAQHQADEALTLARNLEDEIRELDARLGRLARERSSLVQDLEARQQRDRRLQRLEELFAPQEAVVLRQGNEITLRLVGLNFASGAAEVDAQGEALLDKVSEAANLFPQTPLRIEGHTDSVGSQQLNLDLSRRRAESVRGFLIEQHGLAEHRLQAQGFGPERPVASNDTEDGRALNRRIDVTFRID